jgi:hypothetical protein
LTSDVFTASTPGNHRGLMCGRAGRSGYWQGPLLGAVYRLRFPTGAKRQRAERFLFREEVRAAAVGVAVCSRQGKPCIRSSCAGRCGRRPRLPHVGLTAEQASSSVMAPGRRRIVFVSQAAWAAVRAVSSVPSLLTQPIAPSNKAVISFVLAASASGNMAPASVSRASGDLGGIRLARWHHSATGLTRSLRACKVCKASRGVCVAGPCWLPSRAGAGRAVPGSPGCLSDPFLAQAELPALLSDACSVSS